MGYRLQMWAGTGVPPINAAILSHNLVLFIILLGESDVLQNNWISPCLLSSTVWYAYVSGFDYYLHSYALSMSAV